VDVTVKPFEELLDDVRPPTEASGVRVIGELPDGSLVIDVDHADDDAGELDDAPPYDGRRRGAQKRYGNAREFRCAADLRAHSKVLGFERYLCSSTGPSYRLVGFCPRSAHSRPPPSLI
jgi:hypothetical protein